MTFKEWLLNYTDPMVIFVCLLSFTIIWGIGSFISKDQKNGHEVRLEKIKNEHKVRLECVKNQNRQLIQGNCVYVDRVDKQ